MDRDVADLYDDKSLPTPVYFDMLQRTLSGDSQLTSTILPLNCRYFYKHPQGGTSLYVIEQKPSFRTIFSTVKIGKVVEKLDREGKLEEWGYQDFPRKARPHQFMLAFPFMVYFIILDDQDRFSYMKVFCRTRPIQSHIDFLCKVPLSNIDTSQYVCMGEVVYPRPNPISTIDGVIKSFWQNSFNDDYLYNITDYRNDKYLCDFITWEHMSKQDPMFIYNVEWIKWEKTLGQEVKHIIDSISESASKSTRTKLSWDNMVSAFKRHVESDEIDEETDSEIIYNMTDSLIMDDGTIVYQGDSFVSNGNRFFVEDICGPAETMEPNLVMLRKSDGALIRYKLNGRSRKYLFDRIIEQRFMTKFNFNDEYICRDDIVDVEIEHLGNVKRKVKYFRFAIDGNLEMKTNNNFIVMSKIKTIQKVDIESVVVNGRKLEMGQEYIFGGVNEMSSHSHYASPFIVGHRGIYEGIDVRDDRSGELVVNFRKSNGEVVSYNYDGIENNVKIIDESKLLPLPKIFRIYDQLLYYNYLGDQYACYDMDGYVLLMDGLRHPDDIGQLIFDDVVINKLIIDNTLVLRSIDHDIMFSIGDQVVVSDWDDPLEMLKIKKIIGFSTDTERFTFSFVLEDKNGNVTKKEFISYHRREGTININFNEVRPIKTEHEGITSGTKIKSTAIGIANFPKKDTNIIIGFITDTKIPLVLCSNGCTLWFDEMMRNFDLIERDNSRWNRLNHVPLNVSKIKPQDGDVMCVNDSSLYVVCKNNYYRSYESGIFISTLTQPNAHGRTCQIDSYYKSVSKFTGILSPRYRKVDLGELPSPLGLFPKFTGEYVKQNLSRFRFRHDPRRVVNVK